MLTFSSWNLVFPSAVASGRLTSPRQVFRYFDFSNTLENISIIAKKELFININLNWSYNYVWTGALWWPEFMEFKELQSNLNAWPPLHCSGHCQYPFPTKLESLLHPLPPHNCHLIISVPKEAFPKKGSTVL